MLDNSEECGAILEKLDTHQKRLDSIDNRLSEIEKRILREEGFKDGAFFVAAKVGTIVLFTLSLVGWAVMGGWHSIATLIKEWLDPIP